VIERILEALEQSGAPLNDDRDAAPVWPTGSRIDREAVGLLSRAKTSRAVRFLAWQRRHLESCLVQAAASCLDEPSRTREAVETMLARYPVARHLVDGVTAVITGPPNAGKSTLFNRLLGRSATIVSPRAGTTRDWVTASVALDGVPVNLVDTAGRHIAGRFVERRAIEGGWRMAQEADLCLIVLDGSKPSPSYVNDLRKAAGPVPQLLIVRNKSDLPGAREPSAAEGEGAQCGDEHVAVSAQTGAGIDRLTDGMLRLLGFAGWKDAKAAFFTPRQAETGAQILSDLRKRPDTVPTLITRDLIAP
jgi:tRNA modification GTPase